MKNMLIDNYFIVLILILCLGLYSCSEDTQDQVTQSNINEDLTPSDFEEMILIPAGTVTIGTNNKSTLTAGNEEDSKTIYVDAFYMDKYEVTNGQYANFISETGHRTPKFWDNPSFNTSNQPVVGVNWEDAETYARWVGKRLPTDIEWEKAARSLDGRHYPWGNQYNPSFGNFDDGGQMDGQIDGFAMQTAPVGSFAEGISPYGLYDMSGNVWEWVLSEPIENNHQVKISIDGESNPTKGKVYTIRGGSWTNGAVDTRTTVFYIYPAQCSDHSSSVGFRCAKTP